MIIEALPPLTEQGDSGAQELGQLGRSAGQLAGHEMRCINNVIYYLVGPNGTVDQNIHRNLFMEEGKLLV